VLNSITIYLLKRKINDHKIQKDFEMVVWK